MKDILIISNYYPPEKGAAANRIEQMALQLKQNNYNVSIVCPLANYPTGALFPEYKNKFSVTENREGITIKRLWIFPSVSKNKLIRIIAILSFSLSLFFYLLIKKTPQKVVVQSPPLLLSFIAVFMLSLKNKKIILNVSDLWPLAAIELNAISKDSFSHKFSLFLERYIYKKATVILGQSHEIIAHILILFPEKKCYLYRNFPNHIGDKIALETKPDRIIKLFYAGLLGVAQGVLELCEKTNLDHSNIELHLFGDGAEKKQIETLILSTKTKSIHFHGMMDRNDLLKKLYSFDVAIVPLKTRIYGSVPSKIFEYSSLGLPILYFGGGEGETIVTENNLGWVAEVGNYYELNSVISLISKTDKSILETMKNTIYKTAKINFDLNRQVRDLIAKEVF
jgi:glycosyltransferase involved in cell wall biosynthesis